MKVSASLILATVEQWWKTNFSAFQTKKTNLWTFFVLHIVYTISWSDPYLVGLLSVRFKCLWHQRPHDLLDVSGVRRSLLWPPGWGEFLLSFHSVHRLNYFGLVKPSCKLSKKMYTLKKVLNVFSRRTMEHGDLWNQISSSSSSIITCSSHSGNYFSPMPHLLKSK